MKRTLFYISVLFILFIWGCTNELPSNLSYYDFVFVSNRDTSSRRKEIYAMKRETKEIKRLTNGEYHHFMIGISNDGKYICDTRAIEDTNYPDGLGDEDRKSVWIINTLTWEEMCLTPIENDAEGRSISPDNEWIVFRMTENGDSQSDIYKIRTDGSELTRLTFTQNATESDPCWSNDGEWIAYVSYSVDTPRFVLKVMDANGKNVKTIYDPNDTISNEYFPPGVFDPSWSKDNKYILCEKMVENSGANGGAGIWHILRISVNNGDIMDLSELGNHNDMAEYMPWYYSDDNYIIFSGRYGDSDPSTVTIDVYKMSSSGGDIEKLTDSNGYNDFGVWIPK